VVSSEHAGGAQKATLEYTSPGVSTTVTDALGATRSYGFTTLFGVVKGNGITGAACPACGPATQTHDANGNVASRTDWNGNRTNYAYDLARNLETSRTEGLTSTGGTTPQTRTITTEWHATFRLPSRIAEPLRITTLVYDVDGTQCGARGALCSKSVQATTDANGSQGFSATPSGTPRTWTYTYNANGAVLTVNGPRTDVADVTTYTYYANDDADLGKRGNVASITNAAGHVTQITEYNAHGQPLTIVDPNGLTTTLIYDARLRLTSRNVGGEITGFDYDDAGQLEKVTLPDGSFLSYTYDAAHRLRQIGDNLGNRIVYTLDAMGNRTLEEVRDPAGTLKQTRSREYTTLNRLFKEIGAASQTTEYTYDDQGNVRSVKNPLNHTTTNQYDALNRLKNVTGAKQGFTQHGYNGLDALTQVTDPRGLITSYGVNGLGNLESQVSPDTGTTANTLFDAAGNLRTSTDARGKTATYSYDALNRVTQIAWADQTVGFEYDQGTNGKGRLTRMTDLTGYTLFDYDAHGRLVRKWQQTWIRSHVLEYSYDAYGRLATMTYPSGRILTYGYDGAGRVNELKLDGQVLLDNVAYHPFGAPTTWSWGNGTAHSRSFDLDGRMQSHTLGAATRNIGYDTASRIQQLDEGTAQTTRTYFYDELDRLTTYLAPATNQGYGYDAVGNRTSLSIGANTYAYTYPTTSNRLSATAGPVARSFSYDAAGNVTGDGARSFVYDDRGRLRQAVQSAGTTTYALNALGERVVKDRPLVPFAPMQFVYDAAGRLIGGYSNLGVVLQELVFLGDIPVAVINRSQLEVGVDNEQPGASSVGTWTLSSAIAGFMGPNYREKAAGSGSASFTWTSSLPVATTYAVHARWTVAPEHASNAPYTVHHAAGATTVAMNQKVSGGEWNLLGVFSLAPGQDHRVVLTDAADGVVVADAVKFLPVDQSTMRYYVHADHLGSPLAVLDQANQLRWRWDSAPFGESPSDDNPSGLGAFAFYLRFPGQYFDKETNLHYNYYRDYDSTIGRYTQFDPIGLRGGINGYLYAIDPLTQIDPQGLMGQGSGAGTWKNVPKTRSACGSGMFIGPEFSFRNACITHDTCYVRCDVTRDQCDDVFCRDTTASCGPSDYFCKTQAGIYCQAVRLFGWSYFNPGGGLGCSTCPPKPTYPSLPPGA